jgi:hypothetical protein
VYFVPGDCLQQSRHRDKKVVGVFGTFSCAAAVLLQAAHRQHEEI